ncbi:amino acid adenylation domain-containing protein [Streptomyces sp. NPDC050485]|uniref:amino acid adenylation domain-containing protein n=1 Tax=Streptomyces sp. NPDC050485 TaxID=3365617 RepID=UPI0037ABD254
MTRGNLWRAFMEVAEAHPGTEAFASPEAVLDYRQLAAAAAALADKLADRNIAKGDLVAIEMSVGPHFVVSVLAAVAVGAAYLPLDVSGPAKRREQILRDARPSAVLRAEDARRAIASLTESPAAPEGADIARHAPATGDDDPAYVIYTSGSTGVPKGVVVPARGVHNLLAAFQRRAPLGPGARHSWWTSPGFDVSVYEMWSALCSGGTVVPVPDDHRRDIDATLDYLARQRVESAYLPPQFLPALRDRVLRGGPAPALRRLLTGVEPIPMGLLVQLRSSLPEMAVINGYGPTETTVCATLYTVPDRCDDPQQRTPIGTVIEGNRGFVLDERLAPVEPGRPGELFVAGAGLAIGYLHDPRRTAERFLRAADGDGLMYRTGDLVVADPAGNLTFLGRMDDQLKIDGVRIEPAETEAALRRLPEIADVAVLARPAGPGGPSLLTAFVVLSEAATDAGTVADADGLWAGIKERLAEEVPAQAVPRRFLALERIPMTSDGKLDRSALPQLDDRPARPARDAGEHIVENACREVLRHAPASPLGLGFAEMGGDSLQAAQLSAALRAVTGRAVTAAHVLAARTLADLSAELTTLPALAEPAGDGPGQDTAPMTPGQAGIWAAELTSTAPGAFHEAVAVELTGAADAHRVARELTAVLNRHVVFRGRIDIDTMQFVTDGEPVAVAVRSVEPGEAVDDAWQQMLAALQRPAFDLGAGPLVRAAVLAAPDTVRLLIVWHHLVVDAWSARIVIEELAAALDGRAAGDRVERGHAGYARRQREYLDSTDGKLAVQAAAERVRAWLPRGEARPPAAQDSCQVHNLAVGPGVWAGVRDCARRQGTTPFAVTLAALLDPVCQLAGTDGRFALAVADRDEAADADAAGYLLTTVPFGPAPAGGGDAPAARTALRRAGEVIAEAQGMARVPFPSLMAELGLRDARSVVPLLIAWNRDPAGVLSGPGRTARSLDVNPLGARWPWTLLLTDHGELGMTGRIEFPPSVADGQVARFAAQLEQLLYAFTSQA